MTKRKPKGARFPTWADQQIAGAEQRGAVTHTKVKLARDGPRIIEVNGRAGGHVVDLVPRVSGISLVRSALELSLGHAPDIAAFSFDGAAFERVTGIDVPAAAHALPAQCLVSAAQSATDCDQAC